MSADNSQTTFIHSFISSWPSPPLGVWISQSDSFHNLSNNETTQHELLLFNLMLDLPISAFCFGGFSLTRSSCSSKIWTVSELIHMNFVSSDSQIFNKMTQSSSNVWSSLQKCYSCWYRVRWRKPTADRVLKLLSDVHVREIQSELFRLQSIPDDTEGQKLSSERGWKSPNDCQHADRVLFDVSLLTRLLMLADQCNSARTPDSHKVRQKLRLQKVRKDWNKQLNNRHQVLSHFDG